MDKLAIHGGRPAREHPLAPDYPGAAVIGDEEKQAVLEVLERRSPFRYYGPDPAYKVAAFENDFARLIGVEHALAVSSGTAALVIALEALGIGPGDEVMVPANTFIASAGAVLRVGAIPVYVDIDDSFNLDPADLERKRSPASKAIMPVHFEGSACDMDAVLSFAARHELAVLEDVAQACGARYRGRRLGSFGDMGVFSFQINKVITAGEGGAVTTNDGALHERATRVHDQGGLRGSDGAMGFDESGRAILGENYRMSELGGAVLHEQAKKLDRIVHDMRNVADAIRSEVRGLPGVSLRRHVDPAGEIGRRVFVLFETVELARQTERALRAENVPAGRLYGGRPVFDHPQLRAEGVDCPHAVDLLGRAVTLSISPLWSEPDIADIVHALRKVVHHLVEGGETAPAEVPR